MEVFIMEKIIINVAQDFSKTPGGRKKSEGRFSGEEFREKILYPQFLKAKNENKRLVVNLDGGYGYATSFLEEAFGGLVRETNDPDVQNIEIISEEEEGLIGRIKEYISAALKDRK